MRVGSTTVKNPIEICSGRKAFRVIYECLKMLIMYMLGMHSVMSKVRTLIIRVWRATLKKTIFHFTGEFSLVQTILDSG